MTVLRGSCTCQAVVYEVSGALFDCGYCHCSICRKLTGAAAATYGTAHKDNFRWLSGEDNLRSYSPTEDTVRYFCETCGSFLLSTHYLAPDHVYISMGTLDTPVGECMQSHQFTKDQPGWDMQTDALPRYGVWPD